VALDFLTCLGAWSGSPAEVFLDTGSLDHAQNPVNLFAHHHEELVDRTKEELEDFERIMAMPWPERSRQLKSWYLGCMAPLEVEARQNGSAVKNLDIDSLCNAIKAANSVKYFGGSSISLLQRLMKKKAVSNMQCILQAVSQSQSLCVLKYR
jgi:hypothetical protein